MNKRVQFKPSADSWTPVPSRYQSSGVSELYLNLIKLLKMQKYFSEKWHQNINTKLPTWNHWYQQVCLNGSL